MESNAGCQKALGRIKTLSLLLLLFRQVSAGRGSTEMEKFMDQFKLSGMYGILVTGLVSTESQARVSAAIVHVWP